MSVECLSPAMQRINSIVNKVAPTDLTVLITGESGVGKEVVARQIFSRSERSDQPFIKINSAALPDNLLESELFGYGRGAFTGAGKDRIGRVAAAHKGTLFVDEIAELNADSQSKLLHIIQDKEFTPLGKNEPVKVDVRILAATNRDLPLEVEAGTFREDLYYRLNVVQVQIPALRERKEDISELLEYFLDRYVQEYGKKQRPSIEMANFQLLGEYNWPGNVRELENFAKNLVLFSDPKLAFSKLRKRLREQANRNSNGQREGLSLVEMSRRVEQEVERKVIRRVLQRNGWNRKKTAETLQISYRSLLSKIKKLDIQ